MFLDNIVLAHSAEENSISYSEILAESIESSEAIQASEAFAIYSEFAKHTLGSEAVSDWWPKIKAFFRKIWENLKRLLTKMAAWMAALPSKIIALCKKIYTMWVKHGVEGRVKNLKSNIAKKLVHLDKDLAESFKQTDWGIQNPNIIEGAVDLVYKNLDKDSEGGKLLDEFIAKFKSTRADAKAFIGGLFGISTFDAVITDAVIDELASSYANPDEDVDFDPNEYFRETIMATVQNAISDVIDADRSGANEVNEANITRWYTDVKNDAIAKSYEKLSKRFTRIVEYLDRKHKAASKAFDTLYKNDDEDGIKALIAALKAMNKITAGVIVADGFFAKLYATCALNEAKMLNEAIKCYVSGKPDEKGGKGKGAGGGSGSDSGPGADGGKTKISDETISATSAPAAPKPPKGKSAGKPVTGTGKKDLTAPRAAKDMVSPTAPFAMPKSVAKDPDFAAFLKM